MEEFLGKQTHTRTHSLCSEEKGKWKELNEAKNILWCLLTPIVQSRAEGGGREGKTSRQTKAVASDVERQSEVIPRGHYIDQHHQF